MILSYGWDTEAYSEPPVRSVKPQIYQFYNFYLIKKGKGSATISIRLYTVQPVLGGNPQIRGILKNDGEYHFLS